MIIISGRIVAGLGAASRTLKFQMPFFIQAHRELEKCLPRTINVILDSQIEIIPAFVVGPITWHERERPELFGFRSIVFELPELSLQTDAWLYLPYNSPHRTNPFHVEVLAPELQLADTRACRIQIGNGKVIA